MKGKPWSLHRLIAASWVLRLIGESGESEQKVRESWMNLPLGGRIDISDLASALSDLKEIGIVIDQNGVLSVISKALDACQTDGVDAARLLYFVILETEMPIWIISATGVGEVSRTEFIPESELKLLDKLFDTHESREAFLLALSRKFDDDRQKQTGLQGEEYVLSLCKTTLKENGRTDLVTSVRHVSLVSDQLGYDIVTPNINDEPRRLEVKSTVASGAIRRFYISKNELQVGLSDPNWYLILVKVGEENELLGWVNANTILTYAPTDVVKDKLGNGKWEVAKIALSEGLFQQGLPMGGEEGALLPNCE